MMVSVGSLIAAGGFGSASMLAWSAAALIPLVLHLWNRRNRRETPWAAMEFLLAAIDQQSRRMRLEQWLLLLLRMAIPIVFALAMADPIWQLLPLPPSLGSRSPHHHVLVVDTSYSMGYQLDDRTRFQQAQAWAAQVMDEAQQGDGFSVIAMGQPAEAVIAAPAFDPDDVRSILGNLTLQDTEADVTTTLRLIQQVVNSARQDTSRLKKHIVHLFTDLDAVGWSESGDKSFQSQISDIGNNAEFHLVDVGSGDVYNTAISSVVCSPSTLTPGRQTTWQVTVETMTEAMQLPSPPVRSDKPRQISMFVDGELVAKQFLPNADLATAEDLVAVQGTDLANDFGRNEVTPNDRQTTIPFHYAIATSGLHQVEFQLDPDRLPADDRYYQVVKVVDQLRVLCVEGRPGEARNVALALAPSNSTGVVQVDRVAEYEWAERTLDTYDALFLCNVSRITADHADSLRRFLRRGGSVMLFLGDRVDLDNYNQVLFDDSRSEQVAAMPKLVAQTEISRDAARTLLPARLMGLSPTGFYTLDPGDYAHPIVEPFRGQERAGLLSTPVWRYVKLTKSEHADARVALMFENGDPVIVEHEYLSGRVIVVATAPSDHSQARAGDRNLPWTAWSSWPSFPPIVQEMLLLAAKTQGEQYNRHVGDVVSSAFPAHEGGSQVVISYRGEEGPSERRVTMQRTENDLQWILDEVHQAGFYAVRRSVPVSGSQVKEAKPEYYAFNVANLEESRLERVPVGSLPKAMQARSVQPESAEAPVSADATPLFRLLLGLLLMLLVCESGVAWYLGNGRI